MIKLLSVAVIAGFLFVEPADGQSTLFRPPPSLPSLVPALPSSQPVCWTDWFDRDDPSGTGDWEVLSNLRKENPGKICPNPTDIDIQTLSGVSGAVAGEQFYKADATYGFVCRNEDQKDKYCNDYRVRFKCPLSFCDSRVCWTPWFDRDDPSGTGDWEVLSSLRNENPGKICPNPTDIEVETLSGESLAAAGEVIYKADTTTGFVCRNKEQEDKRCKDYRVRFMCPPVYCDPGACWTPWFDRDDPSGTGDWEVLSSLRNENPGKICPNPTDIEVETLSGQTVAAAGEVIYKADTTTGFVCRNEDQPDKYCLDYRVRFRCPSSECDPEACWTPWFDRDDPSGTGDWEFLASLKAERPKDVCETPVHIEAVVVGTNAPANSSGEIFHAFSPTEGLVCRNADQKDKWCLDYKVRFRCC